MTSDPRPPSASTSIITRPMQVYDANVAGNVHGGTIMRLCDEVAALAAARHSGLRVVTATMDRMVFRHPVYVGDVLTLKATVNAAWRTSMEVGVRVESENVRTGECHHTCTAYLTMVALDDDERPARIPPLSPDTEDERERCREAELRRRIRLDEVGEITRRRANPPADAPAAP